MGFFFFLRGFSKGLKGFCSTKGQDSNHLDSAILPKLYHMNVSSPTDRMCQKVKGGEKDEGVERVETDEIRVSMDH